MHPTIGRFAFAMFLTCSALVLPTSAEFTVWISEKAPNENPTPGPLNLDLYSVVESGTLYVYGDGDTRIGGFSLDILATGNLVELVGPAVVHNTPNRWSFLGNPIVTETMIDNLEGVAIPPGAQGIGGSIADEIPGIGFLLGSFGYSSESFCCGGIQLTLRVSDNLFADYDTGGDIQLRLGGPDAPLVSGSDTNSTGIAGYIRQVVVESLYIEVVGNGVPIFNNDLTPSLLDNTDFGTVAPGSLQQRTFTIDAIPFGPLTLQPPVLAGPYSIVGDFPTVVNDETASFTIALDTNAGPGHHPGSISFANDSDDANVFSFALRAYIIPEPSSLAFLLFAAINLTGRRRIRNCGRISL